MLPGEIEPFAQAHIEALAHVSNTLNSIRLAPIAVPPLNVPDDMMDEITECIKIVHEAQRGYVRFKVCMADEVKQKNRYEKYAKEHGYKYS